MGDFGLSKILGSHTSFAQSAVGTPYYLSPELCEGKPYNSKSDVWALGCIMYEVCTFKHAFDATNLPALVMEIVQGKYKPISGGRYSQELQTIIASCLSKNPDLRPSAEELARLPMLATRIRAFEENEAKEAAARGAEAASLAARPFFDAGHVETAITALRDRRRAGAGGGGAGGGERQGEQASVATRLALNEMEDAAELEQLVIAARAAVRAVDRRPHSGIPYFKCFLGKELVDFLVNHVGLESRRDATMAAQRWMDAGVFYHVTRSELFTDGESALFRWREDEVGSILNMKTTWSGEARPPAEIEADFRARLRKLYSMYTSANGTMVDYEGLALSEAFKEYALAAIELQAFDLSGLSFREKCAFFINLFNALVIQGFVVTGPPTNHYQRLHFNAHTCHSIGGSAYSLSDIEHGILRGNQKPHMCFRRVFATTDQRLKNAVVVWDPRVHFALVRGARSSPPLRVYEPEMLDEQLDTATAEYLQRQVEVVSYGAGTDERWQVTLPAVLEWYREDFGSNDAAVLRWVAGFLDANRADQLNAAVEADAYSIAYLAFDWGLNKKHRPPAPSAHAHGMVARPSTRGRRREGASAGSLAAASQQGSFTAPPPPPPGGLPGGMR